MIAYCEGWFLGRKHAVKPLTPDAARKRHDRGKIYAALLGEEPERPERVVEVVLENQYVGVSFLDEHLREARVHVFSDTDGRRPGTLFLQRIVVRRFVGKSDDIDLATSYTFSPAGYCWVLDQTKDEMGISTLDGRTGDRAIRHLIRDCSEHWEPVPQFGDYESIARLERPLAQEPRLVTPEEVRRMSEGRMSKLRP